MAALKVWQVITSTDVGGAETQLLRLAEALDPVQVSLRVACLLPEGDLAARPCAPPGPR